MVELRESASDETFNNMIEIYTDGSCDVNPGPGGWAAIIIEDGSKRVLRGKEAKTTNNRMEIQAVIEGLHSLPELAVATVFSDSQYVLNTMTKSWKRNANRDLWEKLDTEVAKRRVSWQWVRGHSGNPLNEEADALARGEAVPGRSARSGAALTHVDRSGVARMVDVGWKPDTERVAVAAGTVTMTADTLDLVRSNSLKKGDVIGIARVAGIMAAKNTAQLIPLCHPIPINQIDIEFDLDGERNAVDITATAKTTAKTGVEMEAMTAVSVAALTIYDMCKSVDRAMRIEGVRLLRKSGGQSGDIVLDEGRSA